MHEYLKEYEEDEIDNTVEPNDEIEKDAKKNEIQKCN